MEKQTSEAGEGEYKGVLLVHLLRLTTRIQEPWLGVELLIAVWMEEAVGRGEGNFRTGWDLRSSKRDG